MNKKELKAARDKILLERNVELLKTQLNELDEELLNVKVSLFI